MDVKHQDTDCVHDESPNISKLNQDTSEPFVQLNSTLKENLSLTLKSNMEEYVETEMCYEHENNNDSLSEKAIFKSSPDVFTNAIKLLSDTPACSNINDSDLLNQKISTETVVCNQEMATETVVCNQEIATETVVCSQEITETVVCNEEMINLNNNIYQTDCQVNIEYNFKQVPYQITGCWTEFNSVTRNNFTRGCKWAPDGSCVLTCSDDNVLRIFNLPTELWDSSQWQDMQEMEPVVKISEGELVYDFCWYPLMNSTDPSSCCLASTSKNSTVHLWDGFTGELRGSYRTYNHMDEIVTPHSLSFNADGQKIFCGFEKVVRVFNVDSPGRNCDERYTFAKKSGQSGIVSCFAFTSANMNISAAGTYQKTIGIYSEPSGNLECLLEGQKGGVTQLQFSPDGNLLYSGGRKDPEILCWDLRYVGTVLFSLRRSCTTNQRMYFDISRCGRYVVSGNHNGVITIWDITKESKTINADQFDILEPIQFFLAHEDCVNGISLHPTFPLLCSSSGQRKFPELLSEDEEGIFSPKIDKKDNSLRLWWIGKCD